MKDVKEFIINALYYIIGSLITVLILYTLINVVYSCSGANEMDELRKEKLKLEIELLKRNTK